MRQFDHKTTLDDVQNMTIDEAIQILSHDANSDGKAWSARPHKAKAAQMAIESLQFMKDTNKCSTCKLRYNCSSQAEYNCKKNNYRSYM